MTSEIKYGISLIHFNELADPEIIIELAVEAEKAGWDGIFLPDHLLYDKQAIYPITETWILLSAIAAKTEKIKIGTGVAALPRYHPWWFAKMAATLDVLSKGRLMLGLGLGGPKSEYESFGEKYDVKVLAQKMDESLEIIQGLWTGEPFSFSGKYYQIDEAAFLPKPHQSPRIPMLFGGMWPNKKPFIRAAKYDGIMPIHKNFPQDLTPKELKEIISLVKENRSSDDPFELIVSGTGFFNPETRVEQIQPYIDVGITWWLEHVNTLMQPSVNAMREWVKSGPPKS
jgi:alkanesulfonate monooxygenase SsuD/methylene tetrahydromethanopterin reductase-like flavin-dependent oxidoreductase (luciferase family)